MNILNSLFNRVRLLASFFVHRFSFDLLDKKNVKPCVFALGTIRFRFFLEVMVWAGVLILGNSNSMYSQTPVYFNIISHNEISDSLDYTDSESDFNYIKPLVKELCDTIISKQAKYNMQVDGNFINAVLLWDDGANNPNDILEWANNSAYIDVDGHNHFNPIPNNPGQQYNPYKYPDLAKLLDSCGVVLSHNILGGITYADTIVGGIMLMENWTQYASPTPGFTFTDFLWQADIVWGTATPSHVADYTHFGVWKPAGGSSPTEFGTHDPNGTITHIGGGCKEDVSYILNAQHHLVRTTDEVIENVKGIIDDIQNLPTSPNDFYTLNMLVNFRDIPNIAHFADSIGAIIEGLQDYVDQGKMVWATLGEKYDLWYSQHADPNDYFNYACEDIVLSADEVAVQTQLRIYPNPADDIIRIDADISPDEEICIYNLLGEVLYCSLFEQREIDVSSLENGLYFVRVGHMPAVKMIKK